MSSTTAKPSKLWLVALPVAAAAAAFGLWTATSGTPAATKAERPAAVVADPSLVGIAVQQADLPEPSVKCPFSGDFDSYVQRMKQSNAEVGESVAKTWKQLQEHNATAGYIVYWGDTMEACNDVTNPSNAMDHGAGSKHPTTTFSIVVRYRSPTDAESAYRDEIFGQSTLKGAPNFETTEGAETDLGPNSLVGLTPEATIPLHQAIWQNGSITVFYGSENLPLDASRSATGAVNGRIG